MQSALTPVIVSFPREDHAFAAHVRFLLGDEDVPTTPLTLQGRLRTMYPSARVIERDRLAGFDEQSVWYAYRDGHVTPATRSSWWMEPASAWHDIGADGLWTDLNAAMEALVELPRSELVGGTWERFGTPESIASQGPIWEIIEREGIIDSLFRLRRPDGRLLDVEYHMERLAPGRYRCWWHPVRIAPPGAQDDRATDR